MQKLGEELRNRAGQKIVDPEYLLFEAPREKVFMTGSEVVKEAVKRASVDASVSYPITSLRLPIS